MIVSWKLLKTQTTKGYGARRASPGRIGFRSWQAGDGNQKKVKNYDRSWRNVPKFQSHLAHGHMDKNLVKFSHIWHMLRKQSRKIQSHLAYISIHLAYLRLMSSSWHIFAERSDAEDEDKAYVTVSRAELMRGHRRSHWERNDQRHQNEDQI